MPRIETYGDQTINWWGDTCDVGVQANEKEILLATREANQSQLGLLPVEGPSKKSILPEPVRKVRDGVDWVADYLMGEIGWDALRSEHGVGDTLLLDPGTALGLRITEKFYEVSDKFVQDSDTRVVVSKELVKASNQKVVWIETSGVVELGSGQQGTLPAAPFVMLGGGYVVSGLVRYRVVQPYVLSLHQTPGDILKNNTFGLPFSAKAAKEMKAGSEFELRGQGKFKGDFTGGVIYGLDAFWGSKLGFAASATVDGSVAREYSLLVRSLDGGNRVQVTIKDIDQEEGGLTARLQAGLVFPLNAMAVPIGQGQLKQLAEKHGHHSLEAMVTRYTAACAFAGVKGSHQDVEMFTYEFDLSKPKAAQAYEDLLHLASQTAAGLANKPNSGVKLLAFDERYISAEAFAGVTFFGPKLILINAIRAMHNGELQRVDGSKWFYRKSVYRKEFSNWFSHKKQVQWEVVSVRQNEDDDPQPFYHFYFERLDYVTEQSGVDAFFRFAESMGIETEGPPKNDLKRLEGWLKQMFSSDDDSRTKVDLYLTQKGIEEIQASSFEDRKRAFVLMAKIIDPTFAAIPIYEDSKKGREAKEIMDECIRYTDEAPWYTCGVSTQIKEYRDEYRMLTGRDLAVDEQLMRRAIAFATAVSKLKDPKNERQVSKFFIELGKSNGFDYMETIAAIRFIAGKNDSLVHELSLEGAGISLHGKDEGSIANPRETAVKNMLNAFH